MPSGSGEETGPVRVIRNGAIESPDDIVISGISIRCSQSDNIEEFAENLFNGINMVHENLERCDEDHFGVPKQQGFIKDIRKFDATFFGVHPKQAEGMDPQLRILHEVAYESIIDGGVDPASLKNSNTGVFIGTSNSDAREAWTSADVSEIDGYSLIGTHRAFLANRLSFTFDLRGPSFGVDAACATSGVAINQGYLHIKNGVCDAALVGGVSLVYQPKVSYQILKLGLLCRDGKCKVFDEAADGYVRAEAIVCILLQKRKNANRVYATLVHSKINNDGFKEQGITFPSTESQGQLITEVYSEAGIDPEDVEYVEAHGTGTSIGDPQETNGIALGFVNTRTKPLPIGAVKSNMGHSEHASGAVSVCKIIIAMQSGVIPPNLHFHNPNPLIPGLVDGRLKVVTEPMKWNCTIAGVNCFGFGGQNSHTVLRGNPRVRIESIHDERLITYMGRTEEGARVALDYAHRYADNPYVPYLLMQSAHAKPASMPFRGYTIINSKEPANFVVERVSTEQRPVWFVFSGQGTQWPSMGREILRFPAFTASIQKCHEALKPFNLDLIRILRESTDEDFDDPTVSFVGIAAIQVALVDLLSKMKINAEGFIGHSAGEIGCAYADGGFNAQEAMMAAYWRGRSVKEAQLVPGAMAAVGLSWTDAQKRCPPNVTAACNNAKDNVTVSGPAADVSRFVEQLQAEGIFAKEVKSYGIAFHSPAMQKAAPVYLAALKQVLVNPKMRTTRWVSTAVDEKDWGSDVARSASAEYFAHNLTTTVKFHEALSKVPSNAIVVEVAPHGLLQALVKSTVGSQCIPVALMKRGHPNNLNFFLESVGKLYVNGLNPFVNEIFPKPQLPAPRDTPFIGSVVRWDHSAFWRIPHPTDFIHKGGKGGSQHKYTFDFNDPLNHGLLDHKIGNQAVFPVGGFLAMVAKAFAVETGNTIEKSPRLTFSNIRFLQTIIFDNHDKAEFSVTISKSTGRFEVNHGDQIVVTGSVVTASEGALDTTQEATPHQPLELNNEDINREFQFRGYSYGPRYQLLAKANTQGTVGPASLDEFSGKKIVYLTGTSARLARGTGYETAVDGLLQLLTLSQPTRAPQQVSEIQSVTLDIPKLATNIQDSNGITVQVYPNVNIVACSGAEIEGVTFTCAKNVPTKSDLTVKSYGFLANSGSVAGNQEEVKNLQDYCHTVVGYLTKKASELMKSGVKSDILRTILTEAPQTIHTDDTFLSHYQNPNAKLLHALQQILKAAENATNGQSADEMIKKTVANLLPSLKGDLLFGSLTNRNVLQPVVDLAIENVTNRSEPIQILELLRSDTSSNNSNLVGDLYSHKIANVDFKSIVLKAGQHTEINPGSATILVAENYFTNDTGTLTNDLRTLSAIVKDDGFLMVLHPLGSITGSLNRLGLFGHQLTPVSHQQLVQALNSEGFEVVVDKTDGVLNHLLLARKKPESVQTHVSVQLNPIGSFEDHKDRITKKLQEVLVEPGAETITRVWVVAPKARTDLVGLLDVLSIETGGESVRFVVDISTTMSELPNFDTSNPIYKEVVQKDLRVNVRSNQGWGTLRYVPTKRPSAVALLDVASATAMLDSEGNMLQWKASPMPSTAVKKEQVAVAYAEIVCGQTEPTFVSFSGYVQPSGRPVIGLVSPGPLTSNIALPTDQLIPTPSGISAYTAATIPFGYGLAYYGLGVVARATPDQFAVIHADAEHLSDVDAAIQTSLLLGLRIFITGATNEVEEHIRAHWPTLNRHFYQSLRNIATANRILEFTGRRGVDVVYNTSAVNKLQESLRVMAPNSHYIQVQKDKTENQTAPKNIQVTTGLLESAVATGALTTPIVRAFLEQALIKGRVVPLSVKAYRDLSEIHLNEAFQPALVAVRPNGPTQPIRAVKGLSIEPEKVYIVSGDDSDLAVKVAYWLTTQGARKIQLVVSTVPSGAIESQQRYFNIPNEEPILEIVSAKNADEAVRSALGRGAVGGVFLVQHVQYSDNQNSVGADQLHLHPNAFDIVIRTLCKDTLDQFVVLTSDVAGTSDPQHIALSRLVEHRESAGLPTKIVNVGTLARTIEVDNQTTTKRHLEVRDILNVLSTALLVEAPIVFISPVQKSEKQRSQITNDDDGTGPQDKSFLPQTVARIMGIKDFAALDMFLSLGDYGIDSLMAMELGQILERDFDLSLTLQEIRSLCIRDICLMSGSTNAVEAASKIDQAAKSQDFDTPTLLDTAKKHYNLTELVQKSATLLLRQVKERNEVLFIVHPMEGTVLPVLETLANHLQVTTYGINTSASADLSSIESLASSYIKEMRKIQPQGPYNLSGYSFGAGVAFEMALQLQAERESNVRSLVLLDGSHSFVAAFTKTMKGGYTVDPNMPVEEMNNRKQSAFEVAIFVLFVTQFVKTQRKQLTDKLTSARNFDDRVRVCVQELRRCAAFADTSEESIEAATRAFAQRLIIADQYKPRRKYVGDITLVRCSEKMIRNLGELYELDKVCTQKERITAVTVPGNHEGFVLGESAKLTANHINNAVLTN